jgi:hypothetical protein
LMMKTTMSIHRKRFQIECIPLVSGSDFSWPIKYTDLVGFFHKQLSQPTGHKVVESTLFPRHFNQNKCMWWRWINVENWLDLKKVISVRAFSLFLTQIFT